MPMSQWRAAGLGERLELNWRLGASQQKRSIRHVVYDTNFWKLFAAARLRTTVGDRGTLRLHGDRLSAHDLLADHWTSEYAVQTEGRGRSVEEWSIKAAGLDNHRWDCLVGAYVAASIAGCSLNPDAKPEPRKRVRLSEVQARKRAGG